MQDLHEFSNGVRVYSRHLIPEQVARYKIRNVHEPDEEDIFVSLVQDIPAGGCYVNIGAAIGYYPILARKLRPDLAVHAFEPLEKHRAYFLENLQLNGIDPAEIHLHEEAVSSGAGSRAFVQQDYGSRLVDATRAGLPHLQRALRSVRRAVGLAPKAGAVARPRAAGSVDTISLDRFIASTGRPVDLVQMDVQGHEHEVLVGAAQSLRDRSIGALLIGTHGRRLHHRCIAFLRRFGYAIAVDDPDTPHQPDGIVVAKAGPTA